MSQERATVRDVARSAGVSIATVSRVLNGSGAVADATRGRVLDAVAALGSRAPVPRATRPGADPGPDPVFVRCPYVLSDYFGLVVSSVAETLHLHGRRVLLDGGEQAQADHPLRSLPRRGGVAGAVMVLPPEPGEELVALRRSGFPFVVIDPRVVPPPDIAAVSAAHFAGARQVTAHLVGLGHRRIAVVGGPDEWAASHERLAGHASGLVPVGLLPDARLHRAVHATSEAGRAAAAELLDRPDRPTAVVAFNDKIAVGVRQAAADRGLRVPQDLSVAGFDDSDVAAATGLTSVRQPLEEMGRMAVGLLVRLLDGHTVDALHVELATRLVVRGSTGPAPRA